MILVVVSHAAQAGEPRLLASYGQWNAYIYMDGDNKVCYMAGKVPQPGDNQPVKEGIPRKETRGAYALITHRPSDHVHNEFSFIAGYAYKAGQEASVEIGDQKFVLFTKGGTAWTSDADTDVKLVKAMESGTSMIIRGTPATGKPTVDTIILKGSQDAHNRIDKECH